MIGRQRTWVYLVALGVISAVSRLPQLLSPNLFLDGDECTLGLMAKHVAQGKELPIFFYGQHHGLSTVEAVAGAISFITVGVGAVPLKVAMLVLWTLGVLFLFLAQSTLLGPRKSFWISSVLLLNPAWAVWSMKARGGYITAFTATAALLWLLGHDRERRSRNGERHSQDKASHAVVRWLVAGALTTIIFLAQPLWLPGVLPIAAAALISRRRVSCALGYAGMMAAGFLLVRQSGGPPVGNPDPVGSLPGLAQQIYVNLTGSYYLFWPIDPPGPVTKVLAVAWCGLLAATVLMQLYRLLTRRYCWSSHLLFLSVSSTLIAEWLLLRPRDPRYLLPMSAPLVLLAGIEIVDLVDRRLLSKRIAVGFTLTALLLGSVSIHEFRAFNFLWPNAPNGLSEARRMRQVLSYLKVRDVGHVFSMNGLLEWQLMFYSNEQVLARFPYENDRYLPYVVEVNRALENGKPIAVVGYTNASGAPGCWDVPICTGGIENIVPNPESTFTVDGKYFIYAGADRELLEKLQFRFPDE
jgi:hypothetical protein